MIAEAELLGAAAAIEAAAKKLEQLKPRKKPRVCYCECQLYGRVARVSFNVVIELTGWPRGMRTRLLAV